MIQISYYCSQATNLTRTFCLIAEKCYYSKLKTNVITHDIVYSQNLDKALWTYSKTHFIPHGTNNDPFPDKQPILITHDPQSLNLVNIYIFINSSIATILNTLMLNKQKSLDLQKIIFLFDKTQYIDLQAINTVLKQIGITNFKIQSFTQNNKGKWNKYC
jgi:DNA polymerase-3 subunit chi